MGARASAEDLPDMLDLFDATKILSVLPNPIQHLFQQLGERYNRPPSEVDQPLVESIALRPPPILVHHEIGVSPPAQVLQAHSGAEHATQTTVCTRAHLLAAKVVGLLQSLARHHVQAA